MNMQEIGFRIKDTWAKANLVREAMALKLSVLWLKFRLWRAGSKIHALHEAIGNARLHMHSACQNEASDAFVRILSQTSVESLGLKPVIVQALQSDEVYCLYELSRRLNSLETIPNIGPMRIQTIQKACKPKLEQVAVESCRTLTITEHVRRTAVFRDAVNASIAKFQDRLQALRLRLAYHDVEIGTYLRDHTYRETAAAAKNRILEDSEHLFLELRNTVDDAFQGRAIATSQTPLDKVFQAIAASEINEITFSVSYGFRSVIQVKAGMVIRS